MPYVKIKANREKSLHRRHPWIFSGAIEETIGLSQNGETAEILLSDGRIVGRGAYSQKSQISLRVWSFDPDEKITPDFFQKRIKGAALARELAGIPQNSTAYRLLYSESDEVPGIIVDKYGDFLICQFLSAGAEYWKHEFAEILGNIIPNAGLYERSEGMREKEGLPFASGVLSGQVPPDLVEIREGGIRFLADLKKGQKNGFYLDQRDNREFVSRWVRGARVLNCFSYTGGFGIWALKGGAAHVTNVDLSADALEILEKNMLLNDLSSGKAENIRADVFDFLRKCRDSRKNFDVIILDPPKFAESTSQITKAARAYKDINLLAMKILKPGGLLFTFSCSGHIQPELFQKIVADAALDSSRKAQIVGRLGQAADHPVALNFPESNYLKGLMCRVW